jgi:pyruvate/2-oxoglutarate dehydrogenase complex dihydrolipoamide dehydrogenase (E3) component
MIEVHTVVIGAGSGGLTVAIGLAGFGKPTLLIERRHVGGDCTNVGCIPSKTLIHLSQSFAAEGLTPTAVLSRVQARRDHLRQEETDWVQAIDNLTFKMAEARFVDRHTLELALPNGASERVRTKHTVIATGSSPCVIEIPGLPVSRLLTNETLFELAAPPRHLAIVGGGIIASEMAFAFRRLGSRVSVVQRSERILRKLEPEASALIARRMAEADIALYLDATAQRYEAQSETLIIAQAGETVTLEGVDQVLQAVGRRPNLALNLAAAGVRASAEGILTDGLHRTSARNIYAIGDVTTRSAFTHSANQQGRRVVQQLALPLIPQGREPSYPSAIFTAPEVAQVGEPLDALKRRFAPELIYTARAELKATDRGYTQGVQDGFILIHALRLSGRLLSATIVAERASEMIPLLTLAVNRRMRLYTLANLVFPYPTFAEAIKKLASDFVLATLPKLGRELTVYLRYRWRRP